MSTHWVEVQVLWLHEEWGHEKMHYRRWGAMKDWTDEEVRILEKNYETMPIIELMSLLPHRTLYSIRDYARHHLNLFRQKQSNRYGFSPNNSYSDLEFKKSQNIPENVDCTNWQELY